MIKPSNKQEPKTEAQKPQSPKFEIVKSGTVLAKLRAAKTPVEKAEAIAYAEGHIKKFGPLNPGAQKALIKLSLEQ